MTDHIEPANTSLSFTDVMTDKQRKLAEDVLSPIVYLLTRSDVPREKIADVLFSLTKQCIRPKKGELDGDNATLWYAQLQRYRDELNTQIQMIEDALDGKVH
jgi:hypothetical protein